MILVKICPWDLSLSVNAIVGVANFVDPWLQPSARREGSFRTFFKKCSEIVTNGVPTILWLLDFLFNDMVVCIYDMICTRCQKIILYSGYQDQFIPSRDALVSNFLIIPCNNLVNGYLHEVLIKWQISFPEQTSQMMPLYTDTSNYWSCRKFNQAAHTRKFN